ncbi:unnamed protein product [Cochlearia groenlandica]
MGGVGNVHLRRKTNYLIVDSKTTVRQIEDAFKEFSSRDDIAIVLISQYVTLVPGGFIYDPMARTPPRERIEVPHLIDEEITPPPLVRRANAGRTQASPEAGRAKRPKKPRRINSFASSTSRSSSSDHPFPRGLQYVQGPVTPEGEVQNEDRQVGDTVDRQVSDTVRAGEVVGLAPGVGDQVAHRRMTLCFDYERLLIVERSRTELAEGARASAEKERDEARAEVEELKRKLRRAKRDRTVKEMKEKPEKVESDNASLKASLAATISSSEARGLELELVRKAEAEVSGELDVLKRRHDELLAHNSQEAARFRRSRVEYVEAAKDQFGKLRDAAEVRQKALKDFLTEEEFARENFLLWNQLKGIFDTLGMIERRYELVPPSDFVETLRKRKAELDAWLGARPTFSYSDSDFELPENLGIESIPESSFVEGDLSVEEEGVHDQSISANDRVDVVDEQINVAGEQIRAQN